MSKETKKYIFIFLVTALAAACLYMAFHCSTDPIKSKKNREKSPSARERQKEEDRDLFAGSIIEYQGKHYRRNSYIKAILLIGVDRTGEMLEPVATGFAGQADGIFLMAQDTARGQVKILMIPRDTMTEITMTDLSGNVLGKDVHHLTMAYAYGDGRKKSCEYVAEAVSGLLGGLPIDGYVAADLDVIGILNDAVGGVTVTVEAEGMEHRDPAFIKGRTVTLKGKQAEVFVRYRDTDEAHSALYRMDQHKQYISGFLKSVKNASKENDGIVEKLFDQIQAYMITDMTKQQYLDTALDVLNTSQLGENGFYTIPGNGVTTPRYDEFYADQEQLVPLILELFYREVR